MNIVDKTATVFFLSLIFLASTVSAGLTVTEGSVTGRIVGVSLPVPYMFERDMRYQNSLSQDRPRIRGFTIARDDGGYKRRISPGDSGFFFKNLPSGDYSLIRNRVDRYDRKSSEKSLLFQFSVAPGQLVNLGTINIIHESHKEIYNYDFGSYMEGKYLYLYRYERDAMEEGYEAPLRRLRKSKYEKYQWFSEKPKTVRDDPKTVQDSSSYELKVWDREKW